LFAVVPLTDSHVKAPGALGDRYEAVDHAEFASGLVSREVTVRHREPSSCGEVAGDQSVFGAHPRLHRIPSLWRTSIRTPPEDEPQGKASMRSIAARARRAKKIVGGSKSCKTTDVRVASRHDQLDPAIYLDRKPRKASTECASAARFEMDS